MDLATIQTLDLLEMKKIPKNIINKNRKNYLITLQNLDYYFGKFIQHLKAINQYENSLIIVVSDHGQALREKNYYGHGLFLYDEIIEIPLIIKYPKNIKIKETKNYQTLVNIPNLIKNIVDDNIGDFISENIVFSESFGFQNDIDSVLSSNKNLRQLNSQTIKTSVGYPRKAVFKNGYKLVVNGLNGTIDEFTFNKKPMNPKENKEIVKDLLDELYIFKGTEKFNLP